MFGAARAPINQHQSNNPTVEPAKSLTISPPFWLYKLLVIFV
jgi:hypothetical protein